MRYPISDELLVFFLSYWPQASSVNVVGVCDVRNDVEDDVTGVRNLGHF
jgi:hypothetical protein